MFSNAEGDSRTCTNSHSDGFSTEVSLDDFQGRNAISEFFSKKL
jgi:hypothetical protein